MTSALLTQTSFVAVLIVAGVTTASAVVPPRQQAIRSEAYQHGTLSNAVLPKPALGGAIIKPATPVWPEQFGALLFQNRSSSLAMTSLYYDWRRKRNLNLIESQLGARGVVWDVEHDNGTSFIFSREEKKCKVLHFDVGILFPDWLANATLLGQGVTDGFVVDVWTKSEFINYHNNAESDRPVRWTFLSSGAEFHVMKFTPGEELSDAHWQAPPYCFSEDACRGDGGDGDGKGAVTCPPSVLDHPLATGRLMRFRRRRAALAAAAVFAGDAPGAGGRGQQNGGASGP